MGFCTCSIVQAMVALLPEPGDAQQRLEPVAPVDALRQGRDGVGLVARGREVGHHPEGGHPVDATDDP